jgi:hypothetical protein
LVPTATIDDLAQISCIVKDSIIFENTISTPCSLTENINSQSWNEIHAVFFLAIIIIIIIKWVLKKHYVYYSYLGIFWLSFCILHILVSLSQKIPRYEEYRKKARRYQDMKNTERKPEDTKIWRIQKESQKIPRYEEYRKKARRYQDMKNTERKPKDTKIWRIQKESQKLLAFFLYSSYLGIFWLSFCILHILVSFGFLSELRCSVRVSSLT